MQRRAFTLIELLLVLAIIGVATAVSLPYLTRAIRGSKLRIASRAVVMASRYARSMSVLKQSEMVVSYEMDAGRITVSQGATRRHTAPVAASASDTGDSTVNDRAGINEWQATAPVTASPAGSAEITRTLEGISIEFVEIEGAGRKDKGTCSVLYRSNGTCSPHVVKLKDDRGSSVIVRMDNLASTTTEPGGI